MVPYKAPDIETSIKLVGRSAKQEKQSQALNRLKVVYGLLAYKLAHEKPAVLLSTPSHASPIAFFKFVYSPSSREGVAAGAGSSSDMTVF